MTAFEELTSLATYPVGPAVDQWKREGKKIVGFLCGYVPEEILYAADILPYRLRAPGCAETTAASTYMSHLNCSFVRACFQFALEGKYDFLDGLVLTNSCDHIRRLYDLFRETANYPLIHLISIPHKTSDESIGWYRDEIVRFKESVEKSFQVEITPAGLSHAIGVYNQTRSLLRRLYELRQSDSPPLTGAESLSIVLAGMTTPKHQYNQLLETLLEELSQRPGISGYRARLMIAGSGGCDDPAYCQVMEELGGLVVTDSVCFGGRYFWEPVEAADDLFLGLARSYLNRPSCAKMTDRVAQRVDFVRQMVEKFNVDGVVFHRLRYCDLWGGQLLYLRDRLRESDVPLLELEREYTLGGTTAQIRTRAQAFLERLEGRRHGTD